ncbi:MAG: hypothetical protein IPL52_17930 [Flavobacteriales bacterium]|nr:hypothetical protein [Flavobacteriales bacterium]
MLNRTLSVFLALGLAVAVQAQAQAYIFFEAESAFDAAQMKFIIQEVKDADPTADVFPSDDLTILQVRHYGGLAEAGYRQAIERAGITLRPGTRSRADLGLDAVDPNAPPVYVVTGDATADDLRYRAAVEQWNAAHADQPMSTTPLHNR